MTCHFHVSKYTDDPVSEGDDYQAEENTEEEKKLKSHKLLYQMGITSRCPIIQCTLLLLLGWGRCVAVDSREIPGWERIDRLAIALIDLKRLCITNQQAKCYRSSTSIFLSMTRGLWCSHSVKQSPLHGDAKRSGHISACAWTTWSSTWFVGFP